MKVTVTHPKAPWPEGARVGSVVEIPYDAIPSFLAGKCAPAGGEAEVTHTLVLPEPVAEAPAAAKPIDGDALKAAEAMLAEARTEAGELRAMLAKAQEQIAAITSERDAAAADLAKAQEQLQAASKAKGK